MRLAALLLLAPALLPAQTVSGRVVNAVTGEPVRRASIVFMRVSGTPLPYTTSSDANGRFSLGGLEPGSYRPSATRNGFIPFGPGKPLSLASGQSLSDVALKLIPEAVVTGRIVDEEGEPMRNVAINLQAFRYLRGHKQLVSTGGMTITNDLGEYRVFGVAPGSYYLSALPGGRLSNVPLLITTRDDDYASTYYPGTTDLSGATPIQVPAGGQLRGIDMTLAKTRSYHIKGRVTHGMAGRPNVSIVQVIPRNNAFLGGMRVAQVDASGNFDAAGLVPGAYTLIASFNDSTGARRARLPVDVARGNVEGLSLTALPDVSVTGRIVSDPEAPSVPLSGIRVSLEPREFEVMSDGTAQARADESGVFELRNAGSGRYNLSVSGLPAGAYLKSARTEQTDVLAAGLDLTGGIAPSSLTVLISPRGATVSGNVQPAGATVVLIPQDKDRREQPYYYRSVVADPSGAFSITGVPPGEYRLYAWEEVGGEAWLDPDFVKPFENKGEPVTVREGEQKTVSLQAIPASN